MEEMTREQAIKKLRKLLGPKAAINVRDEITSPERRAYALASVRALRVRKDELAARIETRRKELLDVPDFKAMLDEMAELRKQMNTLSGDAMNYRFEAGTIDEGIPGFNVFHVAAKGDTWEEVIETIERERGSQRKT
jgi:hypothetical protein